MSRNSWIAALLLATGVVLAEDVPVSEPAAGAPEAQAQPEAKAKEGPKLLDGMSILGNQEAPKSLVIVPWKSSELGDSLGISPMLDDSKQPVDRDVFLRALSYYEIRSETTRHDGAPPGGRDAKAVENNAAQPAAARRSKS